MGCVVETNAFAEFFHHFFIVSILSSSGGGGADFCDFSGVDDFFWCGAVENEDHALVFAPRSPDVCHCLANSGTVVAFVDVNDERNAGITVESVADLVVVVVFLFVRNARKHFDAVAFELGTLVFVGFAVPLG